jgi:hypothetical protein
MSATRPHEAIHVSIDGIRKGVEYLYRSNAVLITPNATLVCSCTALSKGVAASVSRKAFTRAASSAHRGRMLASWPLMTGALSLVFSGTRSGISFTAIHHMSCMTDGGCLLFAM